MVWSRLSLVPQSFPVSVAPSGHSCVLRSWWRGSLAGHALGCGGLSHTGSSGCATALVDAGGSADGSVQCAAEKSQPAVSVGVSAWGLLGCGLSALLSSS